MNDMQEIIGYNLSDALDMLMSIDAPLKVGAKDGTNFFYCGSVGDFRNRLDQISKDNYKYFEHLAKRSAVELESLVNRFPHIPSRSGIMMLDSWVGEIKWLANSLNSSVRWLDFLTDCGKWAEKVKEARRTAKNAKDRFRQFIPLADRGVMDVFYADPAADPARPLVLIVSGYEVGKYWTIEEAG